MKLLLVGLALFVCEVSMADCTTNRNTNIEINKPDARYLVNGDGTVTDTKTQLMWGQCSVGLSGADCLAGSAETYTWQAALALANASVVGGYNGWRLPNVKELASLVEVACTAPSINETIFPKTQTEYYWTSSPYIHVKHAAWLVSFEHGGDTDRHKNKPYFLRLVRSL